MRRLALIFTLFLWGSFHLASTRDLFFEISHKDEDNCPIATKLETNCDDHGDSVYTISVPAYGDASTTESIMETSDLVEQLLLQIANISGRIKFLEKKIEDFAGRAQSCLDLCTATTVVTTEAPTTTTEVITTTKPNVCANYTACGDGFCQITSSGTPECICPSDCGLYVDSACDHICTTTAEPTTTVSVNPCDNYECLYNGTCILVHGEPKCHCPTESYLRYIIADQCSNITSYCQLYHPCVTGLCLDILVNTTDGGYTYTYQCVCEPVWTGRNCDQPIDPCSPENHACVHGICTSFGRRYQCLCDAGWIGDLCDQDLDECQLKPNPCGCGSTCQNTEGSYNCHCAVGYQGRNCCNQIGCRPGVCGPNTDCLETSGHKPNCVCKPGYAGNPNSPSGCQLGLCESCASGDPHYTSCDGFNFDYMGTCPYVFAQPCNQTTSEPNFEVIMQNEKRGANTRVSYVKYVEVLVYGQNVTLNQNQKLVVNGIKVFYPYYFPNKTAPLISVTGYGTSGLVLETDFHLKAILYSDQRACVNIPKYADLVGNICGLAGNMDGNPRNDMVMPNGTIAHNPDEWGDSWSTPDSNCSRDVKPVTCSDAVNDEAKKKCNIIQWPSGPFSPCANLTQLISSTFENCVYDECQYNNDQTLYCSILEQFAHSCQAALPGVTLNWRSPQLCPKKCGANQDYSNCAPSCPNTCSDPHASDECGLTYCFEGCVCKSGFLLDGNSCILADQCGCTDSSDGSYHPAHSTWMLPECSQQCKCDGGTISCSDVQCVQNAVCGVQNNEIGCYCIAGYEGDGQVNCTDHNECLPEWSSPCKHGHCENTIGSYQCSCDAGYEGKNCDEEINECDDSPCLNQATCVNTPGSFQCVCPPQYTGPLCNETKEEHCIATHHCINGNCTVDGDCECKVGWQGDKCDQDIDECRTNPCCKGSCVNNLGSYTCGCQPGWTGQNCCDDIDECLTDPCATGSTCQNNQGSFVCICPDNVTGKYCDVPVICRTGSCGTNADCFVGQHSIHCVCKPGYAGNPSAGHGCTSKTDVSCASGDPHYTTYDGKRYDYQGTCPYVFSQPCDNANLTEEIPYFSLEVANELLSGRVSAIEEVWFTVYNMEIHVMREGSYSVDNDPKQGSWYWPNATDWKVKVVNYGTQGIEIDTDFNVRVVVWKNYQVCIYVPEVPGMIGNLCGLAGTLDHNANDDFQLPNGTFTHNAGVFGDSWIDENRADHTKCLTQAEVGDPDCQPAAHQIAKEKCSLMKDITGPFAPCLSLTDLVASLYDDCVFDYCQSANNLCGSFANFVTQCQKELPGTVVDWRSPSLCPPNCGPHQHYEGCATGCPATCQNPTAPDFCVLPCYESCTCDDGYVLSGKTCVRLDDCGCTDASGSYHPSHSEWLDKNCSNLYSCTNGTITDNPFECTSHASCKTVNFKRDCYCDTGFTGDGSDNCTDIDECVTLRPKPNCGAGVCVNTIGSYYCQCPAGYTGPNCVDIDECKLYPDICKNGGTCKNVPGNYYCKCLDGFEGLNCENNKDECNDPINCVHGNCTDTVGSYTCDCENGWQGKKCDQDIDECRTLRPCCRGNCVNNLGSYTCSCPAGWQGQNCCDDVDECLSDPCKHGGTCLNTVGSFTCHCPDDTAGSTCNVPVVCTPASCGTNADCFVGSHAIHCVCKPGYAGNPNAGKGCSAKTDEACATGDPHYTTYDGRKYDYQGTCPYVFTQPCNRDNLTDDQSYFSVEVVNKRWFNTRVSVVEQVFVEVFDHQIALYHQDYLSDVRLDGARISVPYYWPNKTTWKFRIVAYGSGGVEVDTDFDLKIVYWSSNQVCVYVPEVPGFVDNLCGLAGTLNKNPSDDFRLPNGSLAFNSTVFGDGWIDWSKADPEKCVTGQEMGDKKCDPDVLLQAKAKCDIMKDPNGPFAPCTNLTDLIASLYDDCYYDECQSNLDKDVLCADMSNFATQCQKFIPGTVLNWRTDTFCPLKCQSHSHYQSCATACPATCSDQTAPEFCQLPCYEGCVCDDGYVLSGFTCVKVDDCGCDYDGFYHPSDDVWVDQNCTAEYKCHAGHVNSSTISCAEYAKCNILSGDRDCHCDTGFSGDGRANCTDIDECVTQHINCGAGTCINTIGSYHCECPHGFAGPQCKDIDECLDKPCQHGGVCVNVPGDYKCNCRTGYTGKYCENDVDECEDPTMCLHGNCTNTDGSYTCDCQAGWQGTKCDSDINECLKHPCCRGQCFNNPGSYVCKCPGGWDGQNCCDNVNECDYGVCANNATCVDTPGSYKCICSEDTTGPQCNTTVVCTPSSCGTNANCFVGSHAIHCVCKEGYNGNPNFGHGCTARIAHACAAGDPHYTTYDNGRFDYQGTCPYTFTQPCDPRNLTSEIPYFSVEVQNERYGKSRVSVIKNVWVDIYNHEFEIIRSPNTVVMDGQKINIPYNLYDSYDGRLLITIKPYGSSGVELDTNFDLKVIVWSNYQVCVYAPMIPGLTDNLCGLAGTLTGTATDDFTLPNGTVIAFKPVNDNKFGDSWLVPDKTDLTQCYTGAEAGNQTCDPTVLTEARKKCAPLTDPNGPFQACQSLTDLVARAFSDCAYDVCHYSDAVCDSFANFLSQCQKYLPGTAVVWRRPDFCPLPCGTHEHYEPCASACPGTCQNPDAPEFCDSPCYESCACDYGYVLSAGQCVDVTNCGCTDTDGFYHSAESTWIDANCTVEYRCQNGSITNEEIHCVQHASCRIYQFHRGCYCDSGFSGNGRENCEDIDECLQPDICGPGTCVNYIGTYICVCPPGRTGKDCNATIDYCEEFPCLNGATCRSTDSQYICECFAGYEGPICADDTDECETTSNCVHGNCTNTIGSYTCKCDDGFRGEHCDQDINECRENPNLCCQGNCTNNIGSYTCDCPAGYTGPQCCEDVDECAAVPPPCVNGGTCLNSVGSYKCECPENTVGDNCDTVVVCTNTTCGRNAQCYVGSHATHCVCKPGFAGDPSAGHGCTAKIDSACTEGDPHYKTFDGFEYDYQGTCPYVFTQPCSSENLTDAGLPYFSVRIRNRRWSNTRTSVIDRVYVDVYNQSIELIRRTQVNVNGELVYLPYRWPPGNNSEAKFVVSKYGSGGFELKTDFNLRVEVMDVYRVCVYVPEVPGVMGNLCGLAGFLDGNPTNDLRLPNGTQLSDTRVNEGLFGDSWIVPDASGLNVDCLTEIQMNNTDCDPSVQLTANQRCGVIGTTTGPFAPCTSLVDLTKRAFKDCAYDECHSNNDQDTLCSALASYVSNCQALLPGTVIQWRTDNFCPLPCASHQHYEPCATGCPATCTDPTAPDFCHLSCYEGCVCDAGYVLSGNDCVRVDNCGCFDANHAYHPSHTSWTDGNCTYDFTCNAGNITQEPIVCVDHSSCKINSNYSRDCVCDEGFSGSGRDNCEDIDECENNSTMESCKPHGQCVNTIGSFRCDCDGGWEGDSCHQDVDECATPGMCSNGGICNNTEGSYVCSCPPGWTGTHCETDVDECADPTMCLHGSCDNSAGSYSCQCDAGWQGSKCDSDVDECQQPYACSCGGDCVNSPGSFSCVCPAGFTGPLCCEDIDECLSDPCLNGGTCQNDVGFYHCDCPDGLEGYNCEVINCTPTSCGKNAECFIGDHGVHCVCKLGFAGNPEYGHGCTLSQMISCASGDPHYSTFDKRQYEYQGTCPYVFSQPCTNDPNSTMPYYSVTMENELRWPLAKVSFVKYMFTEVYGVKVQLGVDQFAAVDGQQVFLPWSWPKGSKKGSTAAQLQLKPYGKEGVELWTDFQLRVIFINQYQSCVYMPTTEDTVNNTCGFGGYLNADGSDDFRLPNGKVIDDPIEFGDSWVISQRGSDGEICLLGADQEQSDCDAPTHAAARQKCSLIKDPTGPFTPCKDLADLITKFTNDCEYDLCAHNLDQDLYCSSLENFATQCQSQVIGAGLLWRNDTFCPKHCNGSHEHYESCGTSCPATCDDPRAPQYCTTACMEGCVCDRGFVLSGGKCVSITECGCTDADGNYHPSETEWTDDNCHFIYKCLNSRINITETQCSDHSSCQLVNFERKCHCDDGYTGDAYVECVDVDECQIPANCVNGNCTNTPGSYHCQCNEGYGGHTCSETTVSCQPDSCANGGSCKLVDNSIVCKCPDNISGPKCEIVPERHCADLAKYSGVKNDGVYSIRVDKWTRVNVSCDMTTDGGGWTIIQRRQSGLEDFNRKWKDYKNGFGQVSDEYWLGNDVIHTLTTAENTSLRVDLWDCSGDKSYAKYKQFVVGSESTRYRLHVDGFAGPAGRGLDFQGFRLNQNGMQFSTTDWDNDWTPIINCARMYGGGFWFNACHAGNPNGRYYADCKSDGFSSGMAWWPWKYDANFSAKRTEMKIRPNDYKRPV